MATVSSLNSIDYGMPIVISVIYFRHVVQGWWTCPPQLIMAINDKIAKHPAGKKETKTTRENINYQTNQLDCR